MHIVYLITQSDSIGGASVHLLTLAEAMLKKGHQVEVLVGGKGPFFEMLRDWAIPVFSIPHLVRRIDPFFDLLAYREIKKKLLDLKPDLLHVHSSKAGILGRYVAYRMQIPSLFTAHGFSFTEGVSLLRRGFYRRVERQAAKWGKGIIAVSDYDRRLALKLGVCSEEQIIVIPNGISDITSDLRADPSIQPPHLIMVARFDKQKDQSFLLKALGELKDLPWSLEFVGDGPLKDEVEALSRKLHLEDKVLFLGFRKDVPERMANSQIFLLISNWEGFPISIIEAMRAGLPVISSDVGGCRELVADHENGFLVARGDMDHLIRCIRTLLTNPIMRVKMGNKGRLEYERKLTDREMIERILSVYHEVLYGNPIGVCREEQRD